MIKFLCTLIFACLSMLSSPALAQTTWLVNNAMEIVEIQIKDKAMEKQMRNIVKGSHDKDNATQMCVQGDFGAYLEQAMKDDLDCENFKKEPTPTGLKFSATCEDGVATTTHIFPKDKAHWVGEVTWFLNEKDEKMTVKGQFSAIDTGKPCVSEQRKRK